MTTTPEYIGLLTGQHRDQPRFAATVAALVDPLAGWSEVLRGMPANFDVTDAGIAGCHGDQLDIIGLWIGRSRFLSIPIANVFFSWDEDIITGWDSGKWQGEFESGSEAIVLNDDAYRALLMGKIAANGWDGTIAGAYATLAAAFGSGVAFQIVDNQDMTQSVLVASEALAAAEEALLFQGFVPIKPAGVGTVYGFIPPPVFPLTWNTSIATGWGAGTW